MTKFEQGRDTKALLIPSCRCSLVKRTLKPKNNILEPSPRHFLDLSIQVSLQAYINHRDQSSHFEERSELRNQILYFCGVLKRKLEKSYMRSWTLHPPVMSKQEECL